MQKSEDSRQAMDDLFRLVSSGQLEQAHQQCISLLKERPEDVNIVALHGAVLLKLGRPALAQPVLEQAIALEPRFAKPHEDLGRAMMALSRPEEAAREFALAIELDGSEASVYGGLANALALLGKPEEAKAAHQQFLQRSPVAATLLEADRLLNEGEGAHAEQLCNELLKREPENTQVLRMLARIASDEERHVIAEGLLRRITGLSPEEYLPHNELGRFLVEQSRFPEAIEMFERAATLNDRIVDNYRMLGDAQALIGRSADALESYERALQLDSADPNALAGQGHMLRIVGKRDEAIAAYEQCARVRPGFGSAWWSLASLRGYELSQEQEQVIQSQLAPGTLEADTEISMRFALARAAEARGDFDLAWQEYSRGNSLKRSLVSYDPVQTETTHDAIIRQFTAEFLGSAGSIADLQPAPIFILGMPRSGSTLLEQVLASHSEVEGAGELPYVIMLSASLGRQRSDDLRYPEMMSELNAGQMESLGRAYVYHSGVHRSLGLPRFTDKMPANFAHVGLIRMILPNARIIDARRHPMATCVANFRQLYARGKNQTYDLVEFAEYFLEYTRMMDHWDTVLPGQVLRVQYEDVVTDLEGQVRRILEFCELPWEDDCLEFHKNTRPVNTASAIQVREPVYTEAVEFWRHYEPQLDQIREILAPVLSD